MKDLAYYMSLPYEIKVKKLSKEEGGGFGVQMPIFEPFALFFGQGESKAEAIKATVEGEVTPHCPASILQQHDDVTIFLDEAAASLLKK